jgi:hypothetical protein
MTRSSLRAPTPRVIQYILHFQDTLDAWTAPGTYLVTSAIRHFLILTVKMTTLADELLNDFEDSDSEQGEDKVDLQEPEENGRTNGDANGLEGMEMDANEDEDKDDIDEEASARKQLNLDDNEDETKAKVEKMKLGGVNDVRNVAGLMKTLQPILEVCQILHARSHTVSHAVTADPASNVKCRK